MREAVNTVGSTCNCQTLGLGNLWCRTYETSKDQVSSKGCVVVVSMVYEEVLIGGWRPGGMLKSQCLHSRG